MTKTQTQIFSPKQIRTKHREGDNPNFFSYKTLPLSDICLAFTSNTKNQLPCRLQIRITDDHKQT